MAPKITVSLPTFNEIAGLLEQQGIKINEGRSVMLEKGTALVPPVDMRLATIRRDCANIAGVVFKTNDIIGFLTFTDILYHYVLFGKYDQPEKPKDDWSK